MPLFKDCLGNEHNLQVNAHTLKQCVAETGHNLGKLFGDERQLLLNLRRDYVLCADVVVSLVVASNPAGQVDRAALLRNLRGDSIGNAQAALLQGLIEFQPTKFREPLQQMLAELEASEKVLIDDFLAKPGE